MLVGNTASWAFRNTTVRGERALGSRVPGYFATNLGANPACAQEEALIHSVCLVTFHLQRLGEHTPAVTFIHTQGYVDPHLFTRGD